MGTRKLWLVARYEYLKAIRRRTFLLMTLGLPVLIVGMMAIIVYTSTRGGATGAVGYVDLAGFVTLPPVTATSTTPVEPPLSGSTAPSGSSESTAAGDTVSFMAFAERAEAEAALRAGEIQAFYVIQPDYVSSGKVELFFLNRAPSDQVRSAFSALLARQLVAELEPEVQQRVLLGPAHVVSQEIGKEVESESSGFLRFLLPAVVGLMFVAAVMSGAGYLLQAVTDEKENRTIEIMSTSLTAEQLIVGKSVGLIAVALSQILVWLVAAVAALVVGSRYFEPLRNIQVPWGFLGITALFFVPAFVLAAGMITAVGAAVSDLRQGQQISGILQFVFMIPFFFFVLVLTSPDHPILVVLTLFPFTSFLTIAMRWGATALPWWQIIMAWVLLTASAAAMLLVAPRVFRRGILRYGQHMKLAGLLEAARSRG